MLTAGLLLAGIAICVLGWRVGRRGRFWRKTAAAAAWLVAALLLAAGGYRYWYFHRPLPSPVRRVLFDGVTHEREIRASPRPAILHVVTINLDAPGIGLLVTPGEPANGRQLRARTTSQFLQEFRVQVAINGSFFHPWHANGPLWYYPHVGDPVDVLGLTVSKGQPYSPANPAHPTLYLTQDNRAAIGHPLAQTWNALSGGPVLVEAGEVRHTAPGFGVGEPNPRTAVALDRSGRRLMLFVVDGRQPNYSEGVTLDELAQIVLEHGGHTALNLDGGGSTTLAIEGPNGEPFVLNSPIHGRIPPGRERPIANHLGIFARPASR